MGVKIRRDAGGYHLILDRGKDGRQTEITNYKPEKITDYSRLISVASVDGKIDRNPLAVVSD